MNWRIERPGGVEFVEADGLIIKEGGVLELVNLTGRPPAPELLVVDQGVVKAYAAGAWLAAAPDPGSGS